MSLTKSEKRAAMTATSFESTILGESLRDV